MPGFGDGFDEQPGDFEAAAANAPVSQDARFGVQFGDAAQQGIARSVSTVMHNRWLQDYDASQVGDVTAITGDVPDLSHPPPLDPDTANQRYGVHGYLRFNAPVDEADAAWQANVAQERQFRDNVLAESRPDPLSDIGANLLGGLVDPVNVGLAAASDGFGEAALGGLGLGAEADAGVAITRLGRLSRAALDPLTYANAALSQVPFVAGTAALAHAAGDDYDFGDALRDLSVGALLHTGMHALGIVGDGLNPEGLRAAQGLAEQRAQLAALRGETGAGEAAAGSEADFMGEPSSRADLRATSALTPYTPPSVDALPPAARFGAWALAMDRAIGDEPVDVGALIARELAPPSLARLDETTALQGLPSWRPGEADTAVTTRGTDVPVRYGLAELSDLTTSHTDDMEVNPQYPAELQPRDRGRAGAMARNIQLEAELNPKLLMRDVGAGAGAPIVSPDGVVESGNGRTIALRRAAAKGAPAYEAYKAELARQGYDATGMRNPVLVRMRTEAMTGAQRSALAHEMNADVTERMSAGEQAMSDARRLPPDIFDHIEDGRGPTTSRAFSRAFIDRVGGDQAGAMTDRDGRLSPDGARRIKAAVLARAYGDPRLVGQVFEGEATPARRLGEGLAEAAPAWARMRALAARGEIPRVLDLTDALTSAMDLVRHAAAEKIPLAELLRERLGQTELFGGESISPFTEALLRLMHRDEAMTRPETPAKIAAALKDYARQAGEVKPGPDLFGEQADETTARAILRNAADRIARGDAGDLDVRAPGKSDGASQAAPDLSLDLRGDGGAGERPGGEGVPAEAERQPGGAAAEPDDGRFHLTQTTLPDGSSRFDFEITDPAVRADAKLEDSLARIGGYIEDGGKVWRIRASGLPESARGQGLGVAMYEGLIRKAFAAGATEVRSDGEVSEAAQRVYASLERRGYTIEKASDLGEDLNKDGEPQVYAKSAEPVYRVTGAPPQAARFDPETNPGDGTAGGEVPARNMGEAAAPVNRAPRVTGQSIVAGDPELRALSEATDRLAATNGVADEIQPNETPDTVAEAVRAAAVCLAEEV